MDPLASICIPTFNGAAFVKAALESASAQTFGAIEILVLDDCSSDGTLDIVREHARQDPRVRVERNPQTLGLVGNWNRCLLRARGEWVKFLFQDDLLDPECLETLLAQGIAASTPFVACERRFLFEPGTSAEQVSFYEQHRQRVHQRLMPGRMTPEYYAQLIIGMHEYNLVGEPPVTLLHKSAIARVGLFDALMIHMVDAEYWSRIAVHFGLVFVDQALCTFRVHGASTSSENANRRQYSMNALDPVILNYKFLFDPMFRPLREQAGSARDLLALRRRLRRVCRGAKATAMAQARLGNGLPLQEWQALTGHLPLVKRLSHPLGLIL